MNERNYPLSEAVTRQEAINVGDFVHGTTGVRIRRLTMPDGSHWFPAVDVCRNLGYSNSRKALDDHVPSAQREILENLTVEYSLDIPAGREWRRDLSLINLRGLISLVSGCTKPSCRPFKEWVSEVIHSIQRDGSYTLAAVEVSPVEPTSPVAYAMPAEVADVIVRLEERNLRLDEEFASVQRESLAAQHASVRALERIADRLDSLCAGRTAPAAEPHVPPRPTAEALLADWKSRMSVTEDVWAVAVTIAPVLAERGELRQPLESIAARTGLPVRRVNECLRFMRKHACIRAQGGADDGSPVYVLNLP